MTNSIRPCIINEPAVQWRSSYLCKQKPVGVKGSVLKLRQGCARWLETEWSHKGVYVKQGDLPAVVAALSVAGRSQSARMSYETSVMGVEQRERRKVDSQSEADGRKTCGSVRYD